MRAGSRGILRRRCSVHKCGRSQCRLAGITEVSKPRSSFTQGHGILRGQFHKEIVRMLSVDNGLALIRLSGLKEQRRTAPSKGKRLKTEHTAKLQRAGPHAPERYRHKPVRGFKLCSSAGSTLRIESDDEVEVSHQ